MPNASPPGDPRQLPFQAFQSQVIAAQQALQGDQAQLAQAIAQLNAVFQAQVQPLDLDNWPSQSRSLLQSLRVEMHRQLRLLATDLLFLKTAKQAETLAQRHREMGDRLKHLQDYCEACYRLGAESEPEA
jgi:hypothetical protein